MRKIGLIFAIATILSMFVTVASAEENSELDAAAKFEALVEAGIFEGHANGEAGLDENMTRAQAAVVVAELFGLDISNPPASPSFSDVASSHWAYAQIEAAAAAGIINGRGNGEFDPGSVAEIEQGVGYVSLQELAIMLTIGFQEIYGLEVDDVATIEAHVAPWAEAYVAAAIAQGLLPAQANYTTIASRADVVEATYEANLVVDQLSSSTQPELTVNDLEADTIPSIEPLDDQMNEVGEYVEVAVSAHDEDGDPLTYQATGLPEGVSIDRETGLISGTLQSTGIPTVTISVQDPQENTAEMSFRWYVNDSSSSSRGSGGRGSDPVNPVELTLSSIPDQTNNEGEQVDLTLSATIPPNSNPVFQATGLPHGLSINSVTGTISGILAYNNASATVTSAVYNVTVNVSTAAESKSQSFAWLIHNVDTTPTLTVLGYAPDPVTGEIHISSKVTDLLDIQLDARDLDGDQVDYVHFEHAHSSDLSSHDYGLPYGLTFDPITQKIFGRPLSSIQPGDYYVMNIVVKDNTPHPPGEEYKDVATVLIIWTIEQD